MKHRPLYEQLAALAGIPEAQWLKAVALGRELKLKKKELFVRPGDPSDRIGLVLNGLFRAFRVSPKGEESVKAFRAEGEMIGPYAEQLQGIASLTAIEALEPSQVLVFRAGDLAALEQGHASWTMLARRVAEQAFIIKERREQEFLDLTAEERLENFEREAPHLTGRVPQRDVAAYLGITEVTLSRIVSRRRRLQGLKRRDE